MQLTIEASALGHDEASVELERSFAQITLPEFHGKLCKQLSQKERGASVLGRERQRHLEKTGRWMEVEGWSMAILEGENAPPKKNKIETLAHF